MAERKPQVPAESPADELAAERDAALKEGKTVIELPAGEKSAPALRVDH